jgi:hypothetical protein
MPTLLLILEAAQVFDIGGTENYDGPWLSFHSPLPLPEELQKPFFLHVMSAHFRASYIANINLVRICANFDAQRAQTTSASTLQAALSTQCKEVRCAQERTALSERRWFVDTIFSYT